MKNWTLAKGLLVAATALAVLPSPAMAAMRSDALAPATITRAPVTGPRPADLVRGFTVTTNSVVGTATVNYSGVGVVTVRWGDGTRTTYTPGSPQPSSDVTVSSGQVVMKHEYALQPGGGQFTMIATASVEANGLSDFESRQVVVTPRYLVAQYGAYWSPTNHCDTEVETYTEWSITQRLNSTLVNYWREDRNTGVDTFPGAEIFSTDFRLLQGSVVNREMTMEEAPLQVKYEMTELDEFFNDQLGSKTINLHPSMQKGDLTVKFSGDDCTAEIHTSLDFFLLKPGLPQPVVSQAS